MLVIYVENLARNRVATVVDDPDNSFLQACRIYASRGSRILDIIDPYTDTMLNFIQLDRLIEELSNLETADFLSQAQRAKMMEVRAAAIQARGLSGYLYIEGD